MITTPLDHPDENDITTDLLQVVESPIHLAKIESLVVAPCAGAIVSFNGVVRNNSLGRQVRYLFYEAYPPMAVLELQKISALLHNRWALLKVAMVHRTGRVEIGESSVIIAASSAHRQDALAACAHAIEAIKQQLPVWKKEYWHGGEVWIENNAGSHIIQE